MPPAGFGAVEKVWHDLAHAFARAGHDVVLIGKAAGAAGTAPRVVALRGFSATRWLAVNLALDLAYAIGAARHVERSDVIVCNSFWTPLVMRLLRRRAGPLLVHVARFPKGQMRLYRHAAIVQAVSSAVADGIASEAPELLPKLRVLPNPVDTEVFRPPREPRRYEGELVVLYVGRVHPEKGLDTLARAMRGLSGRLARVRLRIVGPWAIESGGGGDAYVESLRAEAGSTRVDFVGPVRDPHALALEYQRAHCFCYPSIAEKGEAFGLAPLEAMATAAPVVVSDLRCFADYLQPGTSGLVFDHRAADPAAPLAAALERVLTDPSFASRLGRAASERARDFALDPVAHRYLRLFAEAASAPAR